jgi:hypothetical protein
MTKEEIDLYLSRLTESELSYILGRYCGTSNVFLAEKKFGRRIDREVATEIMERLVLGKNQDPEDSE